MPIKDPPSNSNNNSCRTKTSTGISTIIEQAQSIDCSKGLDSRQTPP